MPFSNSQRVRSQRARPQKRVTLIMVAFFTTEATIKIKHFRREDQKNPFSVRKMFVRNSGAGNGCVNFMNAWKNAFFLQEKPLSIKFPRLGGGYFGFWGGGSAAFIFMGADFSERSSFEWKNTHVFGNDRWRQNSCFVGRRAEKLKQKLTLTPLLDGSYLGGSLGARWAMFSRSGKSLWP